MNLSMKRKDALRGEQVKFLYHHLPTALIINVLLSAIVVAVQSEVVEASLRFGWLAVFYSILVVRVVMLLLWRRAVSDPEYDAQRWLDRFRVTAAVTGLGWGVGSILLSPVGNITHQVYMVFVLGGLCAGAITSMAMDRISAVGFLLPTMSPFIGYLALQDNKVFLGISAMALLFLVFITASARLSERTLHENFTLRIRAVEDEERFRRMLELSPIAACVTDVDMRRILFANQSYAALSGLSLEQVMRGDPKRFYAQPEEYAAALEKLACGEKVAGQLMELAFSDGPEGKKWVLATYLSTEYRGEPAVLGWLYDITDRKQAEEYVQHLAYHDPLTELPNRMLLRDRLNQALALAERDKSAVVLMFVDLDGFKPVNDAYGHDVGDLLLKAVAKRLRDCVRRSDSVARIGGDEFIILLTTIETTENAMGVAENIRQSLNESFVLAGHTLHISSSIGVATYPDHARNARELIHCADIAMYYAKAEGRDAVRLYRPGMESGDERPE
jgi:diguanylate cyclase (GGDEF)-like protein/PAS domain S-box-containing protein